MTAAIILSGGTGSRFGSDTPKQYHKIGGSYVVEYTLRAMRDSGVDKVIVTVSEGFLDHPAFKGYDCTTILGGASRNASLKAGLDYIKEHFPECEKVIINEAARPFFTAEIADMYLSKLEEYDAVITTQKITDSLGGVGKWYVNREDYFLVQAPEAFRFGLLYRHFKPDSPITATSQQLPEGSRVYNNFGFGGNMKITYSHDLLVAAELMKAKADTTHD